MPLAQYNKAFGGKPGAAKKAKRAMAKTYPSPKKAKQVFYATANKRMGEMSPFRKLR